MDHPLVTQIVRTGYPNMIDQPEHAGIDFFGDEILDGDEVVEYDGELVLVDNLNRYLSEEMGFEFKTA
ncbi:YqaI family protein [Cytobacillus horneckiae]|uniref:YqaI family protein n=1 Tax=Cytobacillus horneckiae TaxID=549687 RepID=UPI003D9A2310